MTSEIECRDRLKKNMRNSFMIKTDLILKDL